MSSHSTEQQIQDVLKEFEEKRKKRSLTDSKNKKTSFIKSLVKHPFKLGTLTGLYAVGILGGVGTGVYYVCDKAQQRAVLSEQEHIRSCIARIDKDIVREIRQKYDGELLMLINAYQSGQKLNGFKMAPYSAVFMAHSDLMAKYKAYNPNVQDENRTMADWVLLDHINYRYYQFKEMSISNARGETKNPYSDMLRSEFVQPVKRISVRHDNLFEGLKLDNVMKR